jgi:hypothetical protein
MLTDLAMPWPEVAGAGLSTSPGRSAVSALRRSAPFDRSRPTSAQGQAEERADYSRSAMGLLSTMVMSMLLRRLDVPVTVWRTPSAVTSPARILRTSMLELRRPVLSSWRRLSAARPGTVIELRRAGGRSQSRVLRGYGSPAPWEADAGQARLAQLSRCGMTTLVLTSVEAVPLGSVGYENEINERGSSGRPSASAIGTRFDAQSRPIFYSLPRGRCYARHGVDRPASRHAGPRSLLPRPPQRSMEARPCSSQ